MGLKDALFGKKDPEKEARRKRAEKMYKETREDAKFLGRMKEEARLGRLEGKREAQKKSRGILGTLSDFGAAVNRFEQSPLGQEIINPPDFQVGSSDPFSFGFDRKRKPVRSSKSRFVTVDTKTGKVVTRRKRRKPKKNSRSSGSGEGYYW